MDHLTEDQRQGYRQRSLAPSALLAVGEHLRLCEDCRRKLRESGAMAAAEGTLARIGSPHLTYEELEARVDGKDDAQSQGRAEAHMAVCGSCRAEFQDLAGFRESLQPSPTAAFPVPVRGSTLWRWRQIAVAAALVLAVVSLSWWLWPAHKTYVATLTTSPAQPAPPPGPPAPDPRAFALLALVEPPPYRAPALRGTPSLPQTRFREAMQIYSKGDYAAALPALAAVSALDREAPGPRFYAGICLLVSGQPEQAVEGFKGVIALGESPYLEKAEFYLAKALLQKGDLRGAADALEAAVKLKGDLEGEAREVLRQVRAALQSKP